jgi:hypothetical protein
MIVGTATAVEAAAAVFINERRFMDGVISILPLRLQTLKGFIPVLASAKRTVEGRPYFSRPSAHGQRAGGAAKYRKISVELNPHSIGLEGRLRQPEPGTASPGTGWDAKEKGVKSEGELR